MWVQLFLWNQEIAVLLYDILFFQEVGEDLV